MTDTERTWPRFEEPEVGTTVQGKGGTRFTRSPSGHWKHENGIQYTWGALLHHYAPLREVIAPELPTEDGALIIATGFSSRKRFERKVLIRPSPGWYGDVEEGYLVDGMIRSGDEIISWTEAVAVPKDKLDKLREEWHKNHSSATVDVGHALNDLLDAVDGAS